MKGLKNLISNLKKTPRGKSILFFAFYFIFFVALAIIARVAVPSDASLGDSSAYENNKSKNNIDLVEVNGNNYAYKYVVTIDNATMTVAGEVDGYLELFKMNNGVVNEFYKNNTIYYQKVNGVWSPITVTDENVLLVNNLDKILESATYVAKTEYESGQRVFRYSISSATISNIITGNDLDVEETPNEIIVTSNDQTHVDNVEIILDSYCKVTNKCLNNMKIVIDFSNFEKVSVKSPIK